MKKTALITVLSISTFLAGCGTTQTTHKNTTTPTTASEVITQNSATKTVPSLPEEIKNQPYSITAATFTKHNIKIQYPQIKGLADNSKEKTINDLIKKDILNSQVEEPTRGSDAYYTIDELSLDLKYQVTMKTTELLSVVYTGSAYVKGSAFPTNNIYTITIDLKNATKLKLSDFTTIDTNLAQEIKQSTAVTNDVVKSGMDKETLIAAIQDMNDQSLIRNLKEDWAYNTFYITPNSLVVSVGVAHAIGDYALIELPSQYTKKTKPE